MSKRKTIWPQHQLKEFKDAESLELFNRLLQMRAGDGLKIASALMAQVGEERLAEEGYKRDERRSNLQAKIKKLRNRGGRAFWEDHGVPLRHTDGHRAYLCEPYGPSLDDLKEIVSVADALDLSVLFWQRYGIWNPDCTTVIFLKEKPRK